MEFTNGFDDLFERIIQKLNEKHINVNLLTDFSFVVVRYFSLEYYDPEAEYDEDKLLDEVCEIANTYLCHDKFAAFQFLDQAEIDMIVALIVENISTIIKK